eukprot:8625873-Lingulodinium_polyedra.AAC.1
MAQNLTAPSLQPWRPPVAAKIVDYVEANGTVLGQCHVPAGLRELIRGLHSRAWFALDGSSE